MTATQKQGREVWLPVVSYGGQFRESHKVSTHLRVCSVDRWSTDKNGKLFFTRGRMLNARKDGYVVLSNRGKVQAPVTLLLREAIAEGQGRPVPTSSPEEWREIPGFHERYTVSNRRKVKDGDRVLPHPGGRVRLVDGQFYKVRDLVALAFGEEVAATMDP